MTEEGIDLPHNIEAEQSLLGAVLINNDAYYRVSDFLEGRHFYEPVHAVIFDACAGLIRAGKVATPVTLKNLVPAGDIAGMTMPRYLARLCAEAVTIINAPDYAQEVRRLAALRELIQIGHDMASKAAEPGDLSAQEIAGDVEDALLSVTEIHGTHGGTLRLADALRQSIDMAAKAYQRDGHLSGLATGFIDLDQLMGGLQESDLIVIAGRPGMGKSALASCLAYHVATAYRGKPCADGTIETVSGGVVGFFSLEMSAEQLSTRILSDVCAIPSSRIRRGDISERDFARLAAAAQGLQGLPLYIEEAGGIMVNQLISRARRLRRTRGMSLMIVDYIQLLGVSGSNRNYNRTNEITEITTKLKALAKELNIPIIALSQLSRAVEQRENKRPQLSDLRESGSIEQDADVVMFVYREEYYLRNQEPREGTEEWFKWDAMIKAAENKAELIIGKQRHGPTGTVALRFEPQFTRFSNFAREERLPERAA